MTETLTPAEELKAATVDMWVTNAALTRATTAIWKVAGIDRNEVHPEYVSAYFGFAHARVQDMASAGDLHARLTIREYEEAATLHEGARVALAEANLAMGACPVG